MRFLKIFSLVVLNLVSYKLAIAQNYGCFDSLKVAPGSYCPPEYDPVCSCDGKTYRNYCYSLREGYQQFQSGICENIAININQNPVYLNLTIDIVLKEQANVLVVIYDMYGKSFYARVLSNVIKEVVPIDLNGFQRGVYFVYAQSKEQYTVSKFLKLEL